MLPINQIFKAVFILSILSFSITIEAQDSLQKKFSANFDEETITEIISAIESHFDIVFYYRSEWFDNNTLSRQFKNTDLERTLYELFFRTGYTYTKLQERHIIIFPQEEVARLKGKLVDYSNAIYQKNTIEIGEPSEAGKSEKVHLNGIITDGKTSEPLIGSTVWIENTDAATVTNLEGHYDIHIKPGLYTIHFSTMGYEKTSYNIKLISNGSFNVELFGETHQISEVAIYALDAERNIKSTQMSLVELNAKAIKQLPALTGEIDIIKSFTMMPGVHSVGEFGSGLNVRGGGEDQNLYLIEGAPLFNTSHLFGMLSVINPDFVKEVSLYKGHIPTQYGERISSVMEIKTQNNEVNKARLKGGLGIYNSRLMCQVPIADKKVTLNFGGRTSYSDFLLHQIKDHNLQNSSVSFYDLNASVKFDFRKNKITLFAYNSNDYFKYSDKYSYNYGNLTNSLNWTTFFSENLSGKLALAYSKYEMSRIDTYSKSKAKTIDNSLNYSSAKYSFYSTIINEHAIEGGFQWINYYIQPGNQKPHGDLSLIESKALDSEQGREIAAFLTDKFNLGEKLAFQLGIRYSIYHFLGPASINIYNDELPKSIPAITDSIKYSSGEIIQRYKGYEPRLSMKFQLNNSSSVKLSYNRNQQFISLISNTSISTPEDVWKLSDTYLKPIISDQFAAGYFRNFRNNTLETSIELYYKSLTGLSDFKNDAQTEMNHHIETELIPTIGKNYGIEILIKKNAGKFEGWASYTYSRAFRKSDGIYNEDRINNNTWFPSSYDKPHNLSLVTTYHINKRIRLTGTFNYATGRAITLPEYQFYSGGQLLVFYSDRNKYRLPDYHRLDFAISLDESLKKNKKWKGSWTFSVINIYGRKNAHSVFYQKQQPSTKNDYKLFSLYKLSIIGIPLPTLTYNFIF